MCFLSPQPAWGFVRGDTNGDGDTNLGDAIRLLQTLFVAGAPPLECEDAADVNDDGALSIDDAITVLQYLFVPGAPNPPAPFPSDGPDPTADALTCASDLGFTYDIIAQGTNCGALTQAVLIRDAADWSDFWQDFTNTTIPPAPLPSVDFSTEMVIAVVYNYTSGGYWVQVDNVTQVGDDVQVSFRSAAPLGGCPVTLALTQPHFVLRVPLLPGTLILDPTSVDSCTVSP